MAINTKTREWAGLGPKLSLETMPAKPQKAREFIVFPRAIGKSLVLTIPAPVRKAMSLYESAPLRLMVEGKALRITRLETMTTAQIDVLKAQYPKAKVPWKKKIHLVGRNSSREQYDLQGLPETRSPPRSPGGKARES